jgi:protein TonB
MSTLTSQFTPSIEPERHAALLALAPALPRHFELGRQESSPGGGPRRSGESPPPLLQHIETDPHFRRAFIMLFGGIVMTIFLFLSLPLTQKLSERGLGRAIELNAHYTIPPPPPPPEVRPREEPKPEETVKPELQQETPKLNLAQLEAAINPGFGGAGFADFSLNLGDLVAEDLSRIFELTDLDRVPIPLFRAEPTYPFGLKNAGVEGFVLARFVCTSDGTVTNVKVISSTRYEFEKPAIDALMKWRFEPGIRHGTKVSNWMEQRINFTITKSN